MEKERLEEKNKYRMLENELKDDYGLSKIESRALVERVIEFQKTEEITREREQIIKTVVKKGEPAGKRIKDCKMVDVKLTINPLKGYSEEMDIMEQRKEKVYRIAYEAFEQGGLLSYEDIGSILGISVSTIKRIVKRYKIQGITVPTRGQIEDIGPGITHKENILEFLIRGYTYSEIILRTNHTVASIENYEKKFVNVGYLYKTGKEKIKIREITGYSEHLIESYSNLYDKYKVEFPKQLEGLMSRFANYLSNDLEKKRDRKYD